MLAPAAGRVLKVPVTPGSVVMAGESIATIAANEYLLRLELPERHARFMQKGDTVRIGARGLESNQQTVGEGHIVQVFPELQNGRVIADAEVGAIGDYFVGERALVWIAAGKRPTIVVPADRVFTRYGLDYARLASEAGDTDRRRRPTRPASGDCRWRQRHRNSRRPQGGRQAAAADVRPAVP